MHIACYKGFSVSLSSITPEYFTSSSARHAAITVFSSCSCSFELLGDNVPVSCVLWDDVSSSLTLLWRSDDVSSSLTLLWRADDVSSSLTLLWRADDVSSSLTLLWRADDVSSSMTLLWRAMWADDVSSGLALLWMAMWRFMCPIWEKEWKHTGHTCGFSLE